MIAAPAQPPVMPPLASSADQELARLTALAGPDTFHGLDGAQLLMERALLAGLQFADGISAGGSCRLLATAGGVLAVNLPRDSDWELISPWLEDDRPDAWTWQSLAAALAGQCPARLLSRAHLLGLAVAAVDGAVHLDTDPDGWRVVCGAPLGSGPVSPRPGPFRVVDLSGLWAGPLASHLLWLAGAEVIKVESTHRPDGAREGNADFYRLLNQGKRSVALDLTTTAGRQALLQLLERADVVIESSRPRALRQMGIVAERLLDESPGLTWISICGYDRAEPRDQWIAFGDDAGVAAGLSEVMRHATGRPRFAGDAVADPITGLRAARLALASRQQGGSRLLCVSLAGCAAAALADEIRRLGWPGVLARYRQWWAAADNGTATQGVQRRPVRGAVAALGADNTPELGAPVTPC